MDLVHHHVEEDIISNLPVEIIHHILSFINMKYAVQTSALSRKWRHIWTLMPHLNLNSSPFFTIPQFAKFVKHLLSHRNNQADIFTVELKFKGVPTQFFVRSIINYAYSHNVKKLTMTSSTNTLNRLPLCLFSSRTLKHLTLAASCDGAFYSYKDCNMGWDFPTLETLNLSRFLFGCDEDETPNVFSKCVNLKDLTLHKCSMYFRKTFNVCVPRLLNLTVMNTSSFPMVFNVVAPQLKNFTTSVVRATASETPFLPDSLRLSTESFDSLERVHLSLSNPSCRLEKYVPVLLSLFQKLRSTKFLILDVDIIETLSLGLDQLSHEPCPFDKLTCLKINTAQRLYPIPTIPVQVRNYLLENSPNATFLMNLPQVPQKRPRQQVPDDTMANKVAKLESDEKKLLEAKIQMQDEVITEQKAMLEAAKLQHENLISCISKCKISELKVQVESGNPDYEVIRLMRNEINSVMQLIPESLRVAMEAQFSSQYEEVKSLFLTRINDSQWAKIESELGYIRHSESTHSNNI
ncbi:F-box domain, cyclin-like protein [Artemisia annua]|uniref:F-box domain, cyclin-like protein n=1 Tax=Artemisia annua TaxID=35608 RepID=A0A2U1N6R5_ARTAN|nr:F-box domain, cyclin-like protein [Artemisia annua]